jgi:hypothetical protein
MATIHVEAIKTTYFVASSRFFTFAMSTMHGHMNIKLFKKLPVHPKRATLSLIKVKSCNTFLRLLLVCSRICMFTKRVTREAQKEKYVR